MHQAVSINCEIRQPGEASISALSSAALYGRGVFSTIAVWGGVPFLWDKHWRRMRDNSAKTGIDLTEFSEQTTRSALSELLERNSVVNGRARITFFDESASNIWPFENERKTSLLITSADARPRSDAISLTISPFTINSTSPLAGVKSCNYFENILASELAKLKGFDEAIILNERGRVTSACMANLFWLKDGELYTPSLQTGCIAGTTREFILEKTRCNEVQAGASTLQAVDAIFLTSAGVGVERVSVFEGRRLMQIDHEISGLLRLA